MRRGPFSWTRDLPSEHLRLLLDLRWPFGGDGRGGGHATRLARFEIGHINSVTGTKSSIKIENIFPIILAFISFYGTNKYYVKFVVGGLDLRIFLVLFHLARSMLQGLPSNHSSVPSPPSGRSRPVAISSSIAATHISPSVPHKHRKQLTHIATRASHILSHAPGPDRHVKTGVLPALLPV